MKPSHLGKTGYFLPDDWLLWQGGGSLEAIKLTSGDRIEIEASVEADALDGQLSASVWSTLARFEPLVGQLRTQLRAGALQPLTRATVLRGSGWRQLFVELTGRCNERCVHCYAESSPARSEALEWSDIRRVLEDAKTLGFGLVQLTGGDPLISPHCIPAVELCIELGVPEVEIYTNGLALRGEVYECLRALGPSFAFSFYSHDPEHHDAITQTPGSHSRTTRAIRRAIEDGLKVRVGVISMHQNGADAPSTHRYLRDLGVPDGSIRFDRMRDVGRGQPMTSIPGAPAPSAGIGGVESLRPRNFGGSAAVSYDGVVYPCIFSRHLPLGSIRDDRLQAILTAPHPVAPPERSLLTAGSRWGAKLSCWECQMRAELLDGTCRA